MSAVVNKLCGRCHQTDLTDFSKCKNCGAKYDAKPFKKEQASFGGEAMIGLIIVGVVVMLYFYLKGH